MSIRNVCFGLKKKKENEKRKKEEIKKKKTYHYYYYNLNIISIKKMYEELLLSLYQMMANKFKLLHATRRMLS